MNCINGTLLFTGWFNRPWRLVQESGAEVDLFPLIDGVFQRANGQPASHDQTLSSYEFDVDPVSDFDLVHETDKHVYLDKRGDFGFSNVAAYLESALGWLSGRSVFVDIEDNRFSIRANPAEEVFTLKFFGKGNSCRVPTGKERDLCKVGEADCCIFLACGPDGFECLKFADGTARMLLDRHHRGDMRASRIGNCAVNGRESGRESGDEKCK